MKSAEFGDGLGFFSFAASAGGKLSPRLLEPVTIPLNSLYSMSDAGISPELITPDPEEVLPSVEVKILPFRERCERFLERSHESTSPIALELTNVPLWMRERNDAARAQAEAEGRTFESITLGSFSLEELEARFHNDDAVYLINLYREDPKALAIAQHYSYQWSHLLNNFILDEDVRASGFAVTAYEPNPKIAKDWDELEGFIDKMHELDKKVIVDYVPNHVGLSHRWADPNSDQFHPEYFIHASEQEVAMLNNFRNNPSIIEAIRNKPENERSDYEKYVDWTFLSFERVEKQEEDDESTVYYLAHGRDPNSLPWIDTLQLNYTNLDLQRAMRDQALELVEHGVDGFRCDMAQLPTYEKMRRTWGEDRYFKDRDRDVKVVWDGDKEVKVPGLLSNEELDMLNQNAYWPPTIIELNDKAKQLAYDKAINAGKSEEEAGEIHDRTHFITIAEAYDDRDKDELGNVSQVTSQWASDKVRGQDAVSTKPREGAFDLIYAKDLLDHFFQLYTRSDPYVNYETVRDHIKRIIHSSENGLFNQILFIENHDQKRAAAEFGPASKAFATLAACVREALPPKPGEQGIVFLVHQGQDEGRTIKPEVQMARMPSENPSKDYVEFYNSNEPGSLIKGLLPLKVSKLFQEGTCTLLDLDSSNTNPSLFVFLYEIEDERFGKIAAVVTINLGNHQATGVIPGIEKGMDLSVVSMTMDREIERPDPERKDGLFVELSPYEVQIAYYDPDSQVQERLAA